MNKQVLENAETCFRTYMRLTDAVSKDKDNLVYLYWPPFVIDKNLTKVYLGQYEGDIQKDTKKFAGSMAMVLLSSVALSVLRNYKFQDDFETEFLDVLKSVEGNPGIHEFKRAAESLNTRLIAFMKKNEPVKVLVPENAKEKKVLDARKDI